MPTNPPDAAKLAEALERHRKHMTAVDTNVRASPYFVPARDDELAYFDPSRFNDDCRTLAAAYVALAARPPGDDLEPVTNDWLLSVGFKDEEYSYALRSPHGDDWYHHLRHTQVSVRKLEWKWHANGIGVCDQPTRGAVRRLCLALGIELKEPTP